ncbi:cobalamin-binding protein [Paractinoplanes abujensis]|uniref:Methanogenic corrinoid protein MtbC1 n=1 Tax=Paractinoplanes abujensis TaxID=882441 RepID=A0A7W7CL38_9ACTN|nr:cobalamin-dependent protein [Actinoplanes abujensis]MBB4690304.1 methanogenic corrinoid protein MtbC1 [Actinoplanes abujensis]GID21067.1 cobalamin-binding protein [Actinoplanes abujensis]
MSVASRRSLDDPGLHDEFLDLIGQGDEYGAVEIVNELLDGGAAPQRVIVDLIGAAQIRVGELWAVNEWTVAREHAATAISDRALAALAARTNVRPTRGRVTIACVDGEWHALPTRMLAEMLRLDGWRVDFLGANVPGPHLISHLHQTGPDVVALSCMIATRLPRAHAAITACKAAGIPVIAGGRGFGPGGRYAQHLGADAWAAGAEEAVRRLARNWPPHNQDPQLSAFLGDDEYTYVVRHRPQLIDTAIQRLTDAYPAMRTYNQRQLDSTAEDMAHIVDFLAAALYVSETAIFTDFVTWTHQVLQARGVPTVALRVGLETVQAQLRDYPRATAMLTAGMRLLNQ